MSIIPSLFGTRDSFHNINPFSLDIWNGPSLLKSGQSDEIAAIANAQIDWKETPGAHIIKADIPGPKKEEVNVEVDQEGRILQISGERRKEIEEKNDKWHRVERRCGNFMRRFQLPENAKLDEVRASLENGVLTVPVPKQEVKKPEVKSIEISG